MNENADDVIKMYGVKKFPTLLVLTYNDQTKDFEKEVYKGPIKYERIVEFLKGFAAESKLIRTPERMMPAQEAAAPKPEVKELTAGNFENEIRGNTNGLFVHFTKGEEHPAWEDAIEKFE